MKKATKKEDSKCVMWISDIIRDWNENHEAYSKLFNTTLDFNEFLVFCAEKYTILPK